MSPTSDEVHDATPEGDGTELKRVIGPKLLLLFIVGDILGTGVYALTGEVAGVVGGAAWAPFLIAFIVATITALLLPRAGHQLPAGGRRGALHAQGVRRALPDVPGRFTVMCSGITWPPPRRTPSPDFMNTGFGLDFAAGGAALTGLALGFMLLVALVNFRGVSESVKANVVLTMVELSGLLLVIFVGLYAITQGNADFEPGGGVRVRRGQERVLRLSPPRPRWRSSRWSGFEDSVNMAEECQDPARDFPKMMLTGLGITGLIYVLVSITAVALVPVGELDRRGGPTPR